MWELKYSADDLNVLWFTYKGRTFALTSHPYEPLIYIKDEGKLVCILHMAFNTFELIDAFSKGGSVKAADRKDYDEQAFCEAVAAALDDGRGELDFTYAAKLALKRKEERI